MSDPAKYDVAKLRELAARCESASGDDRRSVMARRELDMALHDFFGFTREDHCRDWRRQDGRTHSPLSREQYLAAWARYFTTSRDDADLLFERVLPKNGCIEGKGRLRPEEPLFGVIVYADLTRFSVLGEAEGDAPARVKCLAILRALIAIEEAKA